MKTGLSVLLVILAIAAFRGAAAQEPSPAAPPTSWPALIAKGVMPYHQLTVSDFPVNDAAPPEFAYYIKAALAPSYRFMLKPYDGFAYAYVEQWQVFSGFNKNESYRKSAFKTMKAELPYAQALLDLNEIHARLLAAQKNGELPQVRGNTFEEARIELTKRIEELVAANNRATETEMDAFAKATKNGANKKKVRELAAEISRRLEATPAATVPFTEASTALATLPPSPAPIVSEVPPPPASNK